MGAKPVCPTHKKPLCRKPTKFGGRWDCAVEGCDVVFWEGSTSTPATLETRQLRKRCHDLFDPLWMRDSERFGRTGRSGHRVGRGHRRRRAYEWLSQAMGLPHQLTHFGMFSADQCRVALAKIEKLRKEIADASESQAAD